MSEGVGGMVDLIKRNNLIASDTVAEGSLKTTGSLRIKGHFKGNVYAEGTVSVSPTGRVIGTLSAKHAEVEGTVEGLLEGFQNASLDHTASVQGVITSPTLVVTTGASVVGFCAITPNEAERKQAQEKYLSGVDHSNVRTVTLSFPLPDAQSVRIIGDFCEWDQAKALPCYRSNNGHWSTQLQLKPGRYEYLILADGNPHLDPTNNNKVPNSFGGHNSVMTVT